MLTCASVTPSAISPPPWPLGRETWLWPTLPVRAGRLSVRASPPSRTRLPDARVLNKVRCLPRHVRSDLMCDARVGARRSSAAALADAAAVSECGACIASHVCVVFVGASCVCVCALHTLCACAGHRCARVGGLGAECVLCVSERMAGLACALVWVW